MQSHEVHSSASNSLGASVHAVSSVITRAHCHDFACRSYALFLCFQKSHALLTLPNGKPTTEQEPEHSLLAMLWCLCVSGCV